MIKKLKPIIISTFIITFMSAGTVYAYSSSFGGSWKNGDTIDGSKLNRYYNLKAGNTNISGTAKVENTNLGATEKVFIEVRRKTSTGSTRAHYYTSGNYKSYINFKTSFKAKSGKHYLILRKAQRNVPGSISGTISQ